jgi:predicted dehydrogenase
MTGLEGRKVYCHEWNPPGSWYRHGSSAAAIFDMSNGAVFNYRGSWCADGAPTSWESTWRIIGERGSLKWDGLDTITAEVVAGGARDGLFDRTSPVEIPPLDVSDATGGHLAIMKQFVAAVRGGPLPETISADNLNSLAMVFGAIRSAETSHPVAIEI